MSRIAVVLFNLGGPDTPAAVRPFLFNLFNDAAIIRLPQPFRWLLAQLISRRRAPIAKEIYREIGGSSPLLELTCAQAQALEKDLSEDHDVRVFVAMRYWHPMSEEAAKQVAAFAPEQIILLPLYPQFSTTTTGSSIDDWHRAAKRQGLRVPTVAIGCYPTVAGLIAAHTELIAQALEKVPAGQRVRILFSAHGLPKRVIDDGDPYQWQVEQTADAIVGTLGSEEIDYVVCYQSKVGRLEWIGPSTDDEIKRAGEDGVGVVVVPIAFVSEHSETLVELDIEYRALAEEHGVPCYVRVSALGTHPSFIKALDWLVLCALGKCGCVSQTGTRLCPKAFGACVCETSADV